MYAPKNKASKYMKQKLLELIGQIDYPTDRVKDFNTIVSGQVDRKIRKHIEENYTISLYDLISTYRTLCPIRIQIQVPMEHSPS